MRKSLLPGALLVGLLLSAGCQKLNVEKDVDLKGPSVHKIEVSAPTYKQNVKATIEPQDAPVSAYLVTEANVSAVEKALDAYQTPDEKLVLAGKTNKPIDAKSNFDLEAAIPAKTAYVLILSGMKDTKVKVKIVGK